MIQTNFHYVPHLILKKLISLNHLVYPGCKQGFWAKLLHYLLSCDD